MLIDAKALCCAAYLTVEVVVVVEVPVVDPSPPPDTSNAAEVRAAMVPTPIACEPPCADDDAVLPAATPDVVAA